MFYWKINYYKVTVVYVSSLESAFYTTSGNVAVITPTIMNNFQTVRLSKENIVQLQTNNNTDTCYTTDLIGKLNMWA